MVREVRAAIGDRPLRLDANHAWTVPTARDALRRLAPYDIRCIEEPVGSHEELARLRPFTDIAFSAHAPDLRRAVALGVPDFYVLNIVELGGIRRTRRVRARVRAVRHRLLVPLRRHRHRERRLPAALGRARADPRAQPGALPLVRRRRHRGGPVLPATAASCRVPDGPGLGVTLDPAALARCHARFLAEGAFPSGEAGAPERTQGSFGALRRS